MSDQNNQPIEVVFNDTAVEILWERLRDENSHTIEFKLDILPQGGIPSLRLCETNHMRSHVHIDFDGTQLSIAIDNSEILAGRAKKPSHVRIAQNWVTENRNDLQKTWNASKNSGDPVKVWKDRKINNTE